jgi:MoxR-like ATPase
VNTTARRQLPASPAELSRDLATTGYLADEGLATAGYLVLRLGRPLFLEGKAGVGKTAVAQAKAEATGAQFVRLQCYEGYRLTTWCTRASPAAGQGRGRPAIPRRRQPRHGA